ncbi:MAG: oligoendopeptidase F [Acidobacteriota bacterium]
MHRKTSTVFVLCLLALGSLPLLAQTGKERKDIPEGSKWNLGDIYPTDAAWRAAKDKFAAEYPKATLFRGHLGDSPQALLNAVTTFNDLQKDLSRLFVYVSLAADQDTRDSKYQAMKQEMGQLANDFSSATAWFEPEILKMDPARLESMIQQEPKLNDYRFSLEDILRRKKHTGTESEEKVIADAGLMAGEAGNIFNLFSNADFPYQTVKLSDGSEVRLDPAGFARVRGGSNREDRQKVFKAFFGRQGDYDRTFGATLNAKIQQDMFYMKARNYDSTLQSAMDGPNIPISVYSKLIDGVNANLSSFHRYLNLRKRMMGVDQLHYYDLYAPLVKNVDLEYPIEKAKPIIFAAMKPLGDDYVAVLKRAFDERWIDLYPTTGKRSGAYSQGGAYDVHPYMLINYNGRYDDMGTVAHELGHTMQSYFSNKDQPFANASYPTFVAEVASTFNEALLNRYVLDTIKDDATRLSILGNYLENVKGTVFRQTQFAEFELKAHEMAEKGQPVTGETMDKLYMDIAKRYYGHDQGICIVDDEIAHEWSYIPHFYRNYYVYQYATSFTASTALAEKVLSGDKNAVVRYRKFLSAGGSKYPIELLKDAGVDMTTTEPLDLTVRKMNRVMDEMETILKRMGK